MKSMLMRIQDLRSHEYWLYKITTVYIDDYFDEQVTEM